MQNKVDEFTKQIEKAMDIVPDIYNDAIKPSAQELGKTASLLPRTINAALVPLRQWIAFREFNLAETEKLIAQKLANVSPEKIVSPASYIGIPSIQAISYSIDSDILRDLFANLLSNAMNIDTKDDVHPSFVEIIKQLSPLDAMNISLFKNKKYKPICNYRIIYKDDSFDDYYTNVFLSNPQINNITKQSLSLSSLERLGLIKISFDIKTYSQKYDMFLNTAEYKQIKYEIESRYIPKAKELELIKGTAELTPLGEKFLSICFD